MVVTLHASLVDIHAFLHSFNRWHHMIQDVQYSHVIMAVLQIATFIFCHAILYLGEWFMDQLSTSKQEMAAVTVYQHFITLSSCINQVVRPASSAIQWETVSNGSCHMALLTTARCHKFSSTQRSSSQSSNQVGAHLKKLQNLVIVGGLFTVWHDFHVIWTTNKLTILVNVLNKTGAE